MMPHNRISKICKGCKFTKSQENINYLSYIDDIKLFAKLKSKGDSNINNKNILSRYRNGIWIRKMCRAYNEKWKMTTGEIERPNQERIGTLRKKENDKYLRILEVDIIKQVEMKEKIRKFYPRRTK